VSVNVVKSLGKSFEVKVFLLSAVALFVHSLFSNSLFYPWIMGYIIILLALSLTD
jgi:hypothetical protein